jgi:quinol monooxygenase YgiN
MNKNVVHFAVDITVNEGQLEAFKKLAKAAVDKTDAEPGAIEFAWYFGSDENRCRLVETFVDADAVQTHFNGPVVQELLPQLMPLCKVDRLEVYGDPGAEITKIEASMGAQFYSYWMGVDRIVETSAAV